MSGVMVTKHGSKRMIERMGISEKSVYGIAKKAFIKGYHERELKGNIHKYIKEKNEKNKKNRKCIVYNKFIFVYNQNKLITTYQLPKRFRNSSNY